MAVNDTRTIANTAFRVTHIGHQTHQSPSGLKYRLCNGIDIGTNRTDLLVGIPEPEALRIIEAWDGLHSRPPGFNDEPYTETTARDTPTARDGSTARDGTDTARDAAVGGDAAVSTLATIHYTADVFTPDDTDTNVYGEPCEAGHGQTMESGWYDEAWDAWGVFETREEVRPDTIESDDGRFDDGMTLDEIVEQVIGSKIGAIDSFDGDTAYAADPRENYETGVMVMRAAHVTIEPGVNVPTRHADIQLLNIGTGCYSEGHRGIYAIERLHELVGIFHEDVPELSLNPAYWDGASRYDDDGAIIHHHLHGDEDETITLATGETITRETASDIALGELYDELTDLLPTDPGFVWVWNDGELFYWQEDDINENGEITE